MMTVMATAVTRPYRGVNADDRRADRRRRLLEAGLELFGTRGFAATRVRDLCAQAGLTERYFYESFKNLDDLLEAVYDLAMGEVLQRVLSVLDKPGDRRRRVRRGVTEFLQLLTDDPRLARVVCVEALGAEGRLSRRRFELIQFTAELAMTWADQIDGDNFGARRRRRRRKDELMYLTLVGGAIELLMAWVDGRLDAPQQALIDTFTSLYDTIILARDPPRARIAGTNGNRAG
jgi:AcrR family transcriptional regulator